MAAGCLPCSLHKRTRLFGCSLTHPPICHPCSSSCAGNYLQAILAAFHDVEAKPEQMQSNGSKDLA